MRLRYYLRGLGIGMIVTALLMGVALKDGQPLSDAEIRARAAELGMVEGDSRTLAELQGSAEPVETPEAADVPDPAEASGSADAADPAGASEAANVPDPAGASEAADVPDPAETSKSADASLPAAEPTQTPEQPQRVTLVVSQGESSYTVSKALADAGLVEDARDFDQYLVDNGYSKRICTGTYEISVDSTEEEIAQIITRSR